ncbi:uncharacterized protein LOC135837348 [Planococcus citri]|uniref:uncharacterized protein LOC135837348 n=1 Tax=Planococcus citri TaxID=170843 RepID=UPI0031F870E9
MKKKIAIFFLSLIIMVNFPTFGSGTEESEETEETDETNGIQNGVPDIGEFDLTEFQMSTFREIILLFKQALGKNLYEELFLHNGTTKIHSEIINFNNLKISFEIFTTKDDTYFLYADEISCDPRKYLVIKLKQKKNDRDKMMKVTGNLKYHRSENSTQTCRVTFSLEFEFLSINMKSYHMNTNDIQKTRKKPLIPRKKIAEDAHMRITEWKEYSCDDVNEEQRQSIRENTSQAMMYWIGEQLLATQLPFQSIRDKCQHMQNISNEMKNRNFVHLKPNHTTPASPLKSNYNDIMIRGLHDFNLRMNQFEDTVQYEMEFLHTEITWTLTSISQKTFYFIPRLITMNGSCTEFTINALSIKLHQSKLQYFDEHGDTQITSAPEDKIKNLETLILHEIDRELQNNTPCDTTEIFTKTISAILIAFKTYSYKNAFYNSGRKAIYFSSITNNKKEDSQDLNMKHVKCSFHHSLEVDEINYNETAAHVNLQYHSGNEMKEILALFEMKNLNFTSHNLLLSTKETETEIDRNFQIANKTITILSNQNYQKRQRISIGENIYKSFFDEMKDQIISAAESFRPPPDICTDPMKEYRRPHPNYQQNRKKYYVKFSSDWMETMYPFTSRFVEIIIDGTWNFKSIDVGYNHEVERPIFYDLRMENVAGSIKQIGAPNASETVKLNFIVKSLNLHFTNRTVRAEVQESMQNSIIPTPLYNLSLILTTVIMEKIQRSIASFIQQSFHDVNKIGYGHMIEEYLTSSPILTSDKSYDLLREEMHGIQEESSQYDISSIFSKQFVSTLEDLQSAMNDDVYQIKNHPIKYDNDIPDEMKRLNESFNHFISLNGVNISLAFPIAREETCDLLDHSQVQIVYNVTLQLTGVVTIMSNSSTAFARIQFWTRNLSTIITFIKDINGEFQLDVIRENMEVRIKHLTENMHKSIENEENNLKIKLEQISIVIIRKKLLEVRTWFSNDVNNFCEMPHIAANETHSDLLNDSHPYFYSIIDIGLQSYSKCLLYSVSLYGLFNFKLLNLQKNKNKVTKFQFEARNLTARIVWKSGSNHRSVPSMEAETLDVQIETIILIGETDDDSKNLQFFDESTVLLSSNQGNIDEQKTLTEVLNKIVMSPIQQLIKKTYLKTKSYLRYLTDSTQGIKKVPLRRNGLRKDPLRDITDLVINSLRELIITFRQAFGRNLYEELFSQNQTMEMLSGMTNFENLQISCSIFQTGHNMFFIHTDDIECQPRKYLQIKLKQKNSMRAKMMKLTGSLKYPRLENSTQACQVNFSLEFEFLSIQVKFPHVTKNNTHENSTDLKVTEWNENSCDDMDEEHRRVARQNTLQVMMDWVEKRLFTNSKLPFQSMRKICEQFLNDFNETAQDYYVDLSSGYNAATFPWKTNRNDILIRGLHDFTLHMHHFEDAVQYEIEFPHTTIEWQMKPIITQYFISESQSQRITMNGTFKEFTDNAFNITLLGSQLYMEFEDENITASAEQVKNLEALIAYGIDQELRNNERRDVTTNFLNIIRRTLSRLRDQKFEIPFRDNGKTATHVFSIEPDFLQNSSSEYYIKCLFNDSLEIGALGYKQVTARVNLQYQADNEALKETSAFVKMKNFNSTPYNFLFTKGLDTEIERNLNASKKTITILSTRRYKRKDRTAIGKVVFGSFLKEMKDRIISLEKSIRPISYTCKDHMDKFRKLYSNYEENHKKYYISFPADWIDTVDPFTSRNVRIIINGTWNFKSINRVSYSKKDPSCCHLLIENVTGSIKQIDASDLGTAAHLNFSVKCLLIKMNYIFSFWAEVPDSKQFIITSNAPYSNSSSIRKNVIIEKFQRSFTSLIQRGYNVEYWQKRMVEEFKNETATGAMWNEALPQYNISSLFLEKFVETLKNLRRHLKIQGRQINNLHLKNSNEVPNEMERQNESSNYSISLDEVKISSTIPIAYEITCTPSNHTQISYNITLQLTGMVAMTNNSNFVLGNISFLASTRNTIITFKNDSTGGLQLDVACENTEVQLRDPSEKIYKYVENEKNDLKNRLEQISIEIIKTKLSEAFQSWFNNDDVINFCELPRVIATNATYSNLHSDSQRYFYSIREVLNIAIEDIDDYLVYQINLYGFLNFKSLKMQYSGKKTKFEFQARNVTARITWKRNEYPIISMKVEKMDVEIEEIILRGEITTFSRRIVIFPESTLRLSPNQGNVEEQKTLTENLNAVVMNSLANSIKRENEKNV